MYLGRRHRCYEADVAEGEGFEVLREAQGEGPVVLYSDPPWNAGIAQQFRKWAGKPAAVDFTSLMEVTANLVAKALGREGVGFVQMGDQGIERTLSSLSVAGVKAAAYRCGQVTEAGKALKPAWLISVSGPDGHPPVKVWADDDAWIVLCAKALRSVVASDTVVFDPFVGYGVALRVADAMGLRFVGCDLNRSRVERGVRRMEADRRRGDVGGVRVEVLEPR